MPSIFLLHLRSFLAPLLAATVPLACLVVLSAIQLFTYGSSASSLTVRKLQSAL